MGNVNSGDGGIVVSNEANANTEANATAYGGEGGPGAAVVQGGGIFIGLAILLAVLYFLLGKALFLTVMLWLSGFAGIAIIVGLVIWYHSWLRKKHQDEFFRIGQHFSQIAVDVLTASTQSQAELHKALGGITVEAIRVMRSSGALEKRYPPMLGPGQQYNRLPDGQSATLNFPLLDTDDEEEWQ